MKPETGGKPTGSEPRLEVYLDDAQEPLQVVTSPYRLKLDTRSLPDGQHSLRFVVVNEQGTRSEKRISFVVNNQPELQVSGLNEGTIVAGEVELAISYEDQAAPPPQASLPSPWLYLLSTIIILGGVWAFFAFVPTYSTVVSRLDQAPAEAQVDTDNELDASLFALGEELYAADCAVCHQPTGEGFPPSLPALAGNPALADARQVLSATYHGIGTMPAFDHYDAEQLAAVATYIRNAWGNAFGEVSSEEARAVIGEPAEARE